MLPTNRSKYTVDTFAWLLLFVDTTLLYGGDSSVAGGSITESSRLGSWLTSSRLLESHGNLLVFHLHEVSGEMWEERGDRCDRWWGESGESDESYKTDKSDENGESNKSDENGESNKSNKSG